MAAHPKYGVEHQAMRALWKRRIAMGGVACWRCGRPIVAGSNWHLGHDDRGDRHVGPECANCYVQAANRLRAEDARGGVKASGLPGLGSTCTSESWRVTRPRSGTRMEGLASIGLGDSSSTWR